MKKTVSVFILFILALSFVACSSKGGEETANLDGSLEEIINEIYETADLDNNFKEYVQSGTFFDEVTSENAEYYLGKADLEFEEALASEPMIQPGAYSLVLVRISEDDDIEDIKQSIKDNVDPYKWVCVGVDEDSIIVDSIGNIIFLVMSDDNAQALHEGFLSLAN